jgi:hypothetical protein
MSTREGAKYIAKIETFKEGLFITYDGDESKKVVLKWDFLEKLKEESNGKESWNKDA